MSNSTKNLIEYAALVDSAFKEKKEFSTYNRDIFHATEVVAGGFRYAKQEINLLSNELDKRLYGSSYITKLVENFLAKQNGKLNILVETDIDLNHPMIQVCKKFPENAVIKRVPDDWQEYYAYNFMTIDDFGYRFEADREELSAIVSLNEADQEETRKNMKRSFEILSRNSEEIKMG